MVRLNPQAARGAMISVRELRQSLQDRFPDKDSFDRAVLQLAGEGRIDLHEHDLPSSLSDEQRATELVPGGQGKFYNGIVLRA
jgi:hypothetical protein